MAGDSRNSTRRWTIAAGVAAALAGGALVARRRLPRRRPAPPEAAAPPAVPAPPPAVTAPLAAAAPEPARRAHLPAALRALAGLAGFGCIAAAQALLLGARMPFAPLLLFAAGALLTQPLLATFSAAAGPADDSPPADNTPRRPLNRAVFWLGGGFFFALAAILARLQLTGGLLLVAWALSVFAAVLLALDGAPLIARGAPRALRRWLAANRAEAALLAFITSAALLTFLTMPAPAEALAEQQAAWDAVRAAAAGRVLTASAADGGPLYHLALLFPAAAQGSLPRLQAQSALFAALAVPATWLLARLWAGRWAALAAAALTAAAAPTLALAAAGTPHSALAFFSALYLAALTRALRGQRRADAVYAGLALGVGTLVAPPLAYGLALLPLAGVCRWRDTRRFPLLPLGAALLVAVALVAPLAALPSAPPPAPSGPPDLIPNPQVALAEGLGHALLLFNLAADPNPLHGIVGRPIFSPPLAAALVVGALGLAWRLYLRRRWWDALPLAALVVLLLPASQPLALPVRYPDLQRAAAALPVALGLSAWGLALLARALAAAFGKWGALLAAAIFIGLLALVSFDTRQQHVTVFLPQHAHAAQVYTDLTR